MKNKLRTLGINKKNLFIKMTKINVTFLTHNPIFHKPSYSQLLASRLRYVQIFSILNFTDDFLYANAIIVTVSLISVLNLIAIKCDCHKKY